MKDHKMDPNAHGIAPFRPVPFSPAYPDGIVLMFILKIKGSFRHRSNTVCRHPDRIFHIQVQ